MTWLNFVIQIATQMISCHCVKHKTHGAYVMAIVKVTQLNI